MQITRMPSFYREPLGLPLRWQDEQSGELPDAIRAYWNHKAEPISRPQIKLVVDWLRYYINAPCLDVRPTRGTGNVTAAIWGALNGSGN